MRKPRKLEKNVFYSVSNKFHKLIQIIMNPRIKQMLLALIHAAAEKFKFKVKNICILDTHFHMEIRPEGDESLSEIMKYIKQRFTQWVNRTFDLEGSAWKDTESLRIWSIWCAFLFISKKILSALGLRNVQRTIRFTRSGKISIREIITMMID